MTLYQEVEQQLRTQGEDPRTVELVLAALAGEEALERALEGQLVEAGAPVADGAGEGGGEASSVYLQDITVSGFRGIGPEVTLEIPPGPGLTVVAGRNGSGKSSFAEALEVLLTGDSLRWADKTRVWKEGWRNLHQGSDTRISARFQVEGKPGFTTVEHTWSEGDDFAEGAASAQHHGEKRTDLSGVGWEQPLDLYRPLLSYNELGRIDTARPTDLFDTLTAVLGIEPLREAVKTLADARLRRDRLVREVRRERLDHLIPALQELEDERAEKAVTALRRRVLDLEELARLGSESGADQNTLRELADLKPPDQDRVLSIVQELESARAEVAALSGEDAEQAERLVRLLEAALEHHRHRGGASCPVCGKGVLDEAWRNSTEHQIEQLRESADRYRAVNRQLQSAVDSACSLVEMPSLPVSAMVDTAPLLSAWERWSSLPEGGPAEIAAHLSSVYEEVGQAAATVSALAAERYSEREEQWAAVLPDLMAWVAKAREVAEHRETVKLIKRAEDALKKAAGVLRSARWSPIEAKALEIWEMLRLRSNVDLRSVELAGVRNTRRVDLTVDVDGKQASALAVASQGEVGCLALSLFFPRATLPESPFRFLVIDDPVQAMDPARVDGLARVFSEIAADRQLIVFTHDDRLPESLRRLEIEHNCIEVMRRPGSVVEVRNSLDPVLQYFLDARAVAKDEQLAEEIGRRVVPGFCRSGLEAACMEAVRRRRLGRGGPHDEVEQALADAPRLMQKASLALFDDIDQAGRVYGYIGKRWSRGLADAFRDANRGTHSAYKGGLMDLVNECRSLAERIRRQS